MWRCFFVYIPQNVDSKRMRTLNFLLCFLCSCTVRDTSSRLDRDLHMEVGTSHFEVGKPAQKVSLVDEMNQTKGNDTFAVRDVAQFPVRSIAAQHDRDTIVGQNSSARLDEVVIERRAAHSGFEEQDQDRQSVVWQRVNHVPTDREGNNEHIVDSLMHYPGSMFQKGSGNVSVQVFARSITTQGQLLWSISGLAVDISWNVGVMMILLIGSVSCACAVLILRGGLNVPGKRTLKLGAGDDESSSSSDGEDSEVPKPSFLKAPQR